MGKGGIILNHFLHRFPYPYLGYPVPMDGLQRGYLFGGGIAEALA